MKIVVAGGNGFLGRAITTELVAAGHDVAVMSRNAPASAPAGGQLRCVQGDVTRPETLAVALQGAEVVVDAVQFPGSPMENPKKGFTFEKVDLEGTRNLVTAAGVAGVGRFIGLSGVGAASDAAYHWLRYKWDEEQAIRDSGVPFTIFRPSWVYGPGDVSLNRFLGFARMLPFIPVIGDGKTVLNPLFIDDLARHVAVAVGTTEASGRQYENGGPDRLTMNEIVRAALRAAGKRRFLFHQPKPLMKAVASVARLLPGPPLTPDGIDFVTMEAIADTRDLVGVFGLPLTPMEEALRSYLGR
jgi:NADH dehydrogenase